MSLGFLFLFKPLDALAIVWVGIWLNVLREDEWLELCVCGLIDGHDKAFKLIKKVELSVWTFRIVMKGLIRGLIVKKCESCHSSSRTAGKLSWLASKVRATLKETFLSSHSDSRRSERERELSHIATVFCQVPLFAEVFHSFLRRHQQSAESRD